MNQPLTPGHDDEDIALAIWSELTRALAQFGIRTGPAVLALLRDMRLARNGVFGPDRLLRREVVEELEAMVQRLREHASES
jgi:hypothetical protein